jgi:hypothetical protein
MEIEEGYLRAYGKSFNQPEEKGQGIASALYVRVRTGGAIDKPVW